MAFYINDKLYFDFYVNGYSVPLTLSDINSLVITSSIYETSPALRLDLNDNKGIFSKGVLVDGTSISIAVGTNPESALENMMDFILVSTPEEEIKKNKERFAIYAMGDFPKLKCRSPIAITGSSNDVLKSLASTCNLGYDGTFTTDNMTWINGTRNYGEFYKYITRYGWSDSSSCMKSYISLDRKLVYKNINDLKYKYTLTSAPVQDIDKEKKIMFNEISFSNRSGKNNYTYGYQSQAIDFDLQGNTKIIDSVDIIKNSTALNINKNVYNEVGLVTRDFLPTNIGNVHNNWVNAYYQNKKYSSIYSVLANIYLYERVPLNPLDGVNLTYINPITKEPDLAKSSKWCVESKVIAISQEQYIEKYLLASTGLELDLYNNLL